MKSTLFIALLFVCASCENILQKEKKQEGKFCRDLCEIRERGKIVALTDLSSTSFFIYKGNAMGFEYELLKRFAKHIGVALEMVVVEDLDCIDQMLMDGEGDLIAANFNITKERQDSLLFSMPLLETRQVIVQRKRKNESDSIYLQSAEDLFERTVLLRKGSSFYNTLKNLMKSSNDTIFMKFDSDMTTENMIEAVSKGEADYTIADENVARLNSHYFRNIDINVALTDPQPVGWAARQTSIELMDSLNRWLAEFKESRPYAAIHLRYFGARTEHKNRVMSEWSSLNGGAISPWDELLKKESKRLERDWMLLAAIIKRESNFNPDIEAPSGACGLMQLIPETAAQFGVDSLFIPSENIRAGVSLLIRLDKLLAEQIPDSTERLNFMLAAYNVGLGHVLDARALARKHEKPDDQWSSVREFMLLKSNPAYYRDPVVKHGYCRGREPVQYVKDVLNIWHHYREGSLSELSPQPPKKKEGDQNSSCDAT